MSGDKGVRFAADGFIDATALCKFGKKTIPGNSGQIEARLIFYHRNRGGCFHREGLRGRNHLQ
jgi:hypothetical protein